MKRLNLSYLPAKGRPWVLDLYCGAGGTAMGYHRAGFNVRGIDIVDQPHYPFGFGQLDAIEALETLVKYGNGNYVAIHASPPCQAYSHTQRIQGREYPDLIADTRELIQQTGLPYVIENVEDARSELIEPITLCGAMFPELSVYRHRLFECSFPVEQPRHPAHTAPQNKMGRPPQPGEFMHVVGNFSGVPAAREAMDIPWMTRNELKEAVPPAYTHYVGGALMSHLRPSPAPLTPSETADVAQDPRNA